MYISARSEAGPPIDYNGFQSEDGVMIKNNSSNPSYFRYNE